MMTMQMGKRYVLMLMLLLIREFCSGNGQGDAGFENGDYWKRIQLNAEVFMAKDIERLYGK
jgi:hypothetical protein